MKPAAAVVPPRTEVLGGMRDVFGRGFSALVPLLPVSVLLVLSRSPATVTLEGDMHKVLATVSRPKPMPAAAAAAVVTFTAAAVLGEC